MNITSAPDPLVQPDLGQRLVASVRTHLEARAARRQLHRELACFTSPSEVSDMLACVGDSDDPASAEMRRILIGNLHRSV